MLGDQRRYKKLGGFELRGKEALESVKRSLCNMKANGQKSGRSPEMEMSCSVISEMRSFGGD